MLNQFLVSILFVFLGAFALAEEQSGGEDRFIIHILDYLSKDYGLAVKDGQIISKFEYNEQVEFVLEAKASAQKITDPIFQKEATADLVELEKLIRAKVSAQKVSGLAREIQSKILRFSKLVVAPSKWPDLSEGARLFAKNCVSCHGVGGAGDGVAGINLEPKPTNFLDSKLMSGSTPFQSFNVIRLGVPGTGMSPYPGISDKEVWDLSFYIHSLRFKPSAESQKLVLDYTNEEGLKKVSTQTDDDLLKDLFAGKNNAKLLLTLIRRFTLEQKEQTSLSLAKAKLRKTETLYRQGDIHDAKKEAVRAYLDGIEPSEPRIMANDPELVARIEEDMGHLRKIIDQKKPANEITLAVDDLIGLFDETEKRLTSQRVTPWVAFSATAAILLREGFEAVLVILAFLSVIRATGTAQALRWVHAGWITAILLGVLMWGLSGWLINISGAQRELLEAATSLLAVFVLLYVGYYLHSQTEIHRWKIFINDRVQSLLETKNLVGLFLITFIAVFREAFETVLFLRAIWLEGGENVGWSMISGLLVSFFGILVFGAIIYKYSASVPIRKIFAISSSIIAVLALILTGKGFHSLQESGFISVTPSPFKFRWDLFGVYPTNETLLPQAIVCILIVLLWFYGRRPSHSLA